MSDDDDDEITLQITGYAGTTASISREAWEQMSRSERNRWARSQLRKGCRIHDASHAVDAETEREYDL